MEPPNSEAPVLISSIDTTTTRELGLPPLSWREVFGLTPEAPAQAWLALRGDGSVPSSRFGLSSLRMYTPRLAVATWRGKRPAGRQIPIVNLVNRTPTPLAEGWSVKVTQVLDFRGKRLTYDSHNGTDFVIPPATVVVASAPGRIATIRHEYNRGGTKLYLDHGGGLLTSYHHLARSLVAIGQDVGRGQPIGLSGYSGLDSLVAFPWVAPHVHYNVALGGVLVDPFAAPGETSLWLSGDNAPCPASTRERTFTPTVFAPDAAPRLLAEVIDPGHRARLSELAGAYRRAWELVIESTVYPTRFRTPEAGRLAVAQVARRPHLSLPFRDVDYDGVVFADEAGYR